MKTTIVSIRVQVKEVPPSDVEETKDLFRDWLDKTITSYPSCAIQDSKLLPKCVGITKSDRRTLFGGMVLRSEALPPDLQLSLSKKIKVFLTEKKLDTGVEEAIKIKLYQMRNTESDFLGGREKTIAVLQSGPKTASQIAEATMLDEQLNNVLLCLLEEECLIWREETDQIDDIFHLVKSGSLDKIEEAVRSVLRDGPKSRSDVFRAVSNSSDAKARREWLRKALIDLVGRGEVTQDQGGTYSLIV